jgi:hypothetical protein
VERGKEELRGGEGRRSSGKRSRRRMGGSGGRRRGRRWRRRTARRLLRHSYSLSLVGDDIVGAECSPDTN